MRPIELHVTISAPREQVYDLVADLGARVAWTGHYQHDYRLTRPRSTGRGAAARFQLRAPFNRTWVEVAITEAARPRRIREGIHLGRLGRTPGYVEYAFDPVGPSATRVELALWTEPATRRDAFRESLGLRFWLRRRVKKSLSRLRALFEERPQEPVERVSIAGYEPAKAARFGSF